jgi:protein O-mannosyl-transferase
MTSMAALFYILALFLYAKGRIMQRSGDSDGSVKNLTSEGPENTEGHNSLKTLDSGSYLNNDPNRFLAFFDFIRFKPFLFFIGCIASGLAAVASKENAAMLPIFILLYELFFFQDGQIEWSPGKIIWITSAAILFSIIALAYVGNNPINLILDSYTNRNFTLPQRIMTEWRVVVYYISLFFFPTPDRLSLEHDYPLSTFLLSPKTTLLALIALLSLIAFVIQIARKDRLAAFCLIWFLGNLVIESSMFGLEIIFEHRTYLPFMMVSLISVVMTERIFPSQKASIILLCGIAVIFSAWTYQRNLIWQDNIVFLNDCVKKAPNSIRPRFNLATELQLKGRLGDARRHLEEILIKNPYYLNAYISMASLWAAQNNIEKALNTYLEGLGLDPGKVIAKPWEPATAYFNIGSILLHRQMVEEAVYFLEKGIAINPENADAYILAGQVRMRRGDEAIAASHFRNALRLNSENPLVRSRLAQLAKRQLQKPGNLGDVTDESIVYPENISLHLLLGNFFLRLNDCDQARNQYDKIIKMDPTHAAAKAGLEKCGEI